MGLAGGKVASLAKDLQIFPRNLSDPLGKFKFPSQPHDQCLVQPTCQLAVMENMNLRIVPQKTSTNVEWNSLIFCKPEINKQFQQIP